MSFATKILKFSPLGRVSLFSYTKNERYINHFVALVTLVVIFYLIADTILEISNPILKPSNYFFFMSLLICSNFADMKKKHFLFILVNMSCLMAGAQGRLMTIDEVDSVAVQRNLQLKALRLETNAAEGQLLQANKYENLEVQVMHNVQNPINRKWFDMGYDGQTDVQVSQPIAIGGQHRSKVKQARATLNATKAAYDAEALNIRYEARITFIELYYAQRKLNIYNKEIASVEKIHKAYEEQAGKGNVSQMEMFRVAAMLGQLRAEKAELQLLTDETQNQLRLLLNLPDTNPVEACLDEESAINKVTNYLAEINPSITSSNSALLQSVVQSHPEIARSKHQEESARYALKAEKADALPRISLNGEWDKNGSIGHNFFAVGVTVAVPLWNRNQGNVRSAKAQYAQATIERQQRENELQAALLTRYNATLQHLKLVEENKRNLSANLDQLLAGTEEQFLKRNISVVEFVDLYSSYRDANFMIEDAKAQLLKCNEELKKYAR